MTVTNIGNQCFIVQNFIKFVVSYYICDFAKISILFMYLFGPFLSYIPASIASFVMWEYTSWIRGSDPAILNLCATKP